MTPTALLAVNTTAAATATTTAANASAAPHGAQPRADFRKPLQQARQQQQQQHDKAPARSDASKTSDDKSTHDKPAKAAHRASTAADAHDPSGHDDKDQASQTPDAASAMLALLGQSIPAQATPTPVAADDAVATATSAAPIAATLTAAMPAQLAAMPGAQGDTDADADDMLDSKAIGDLKDNTLATANDATEDTGSAFADAMAAMAKAMPASQASASSRSDDHSDPLDALRSLATSPLAQPPLAPAQQAAAPHSLTMQSTAGTPAFAQELGQQVAWLGGQDIKQARIRLHPEDLGQLDVKVSVKQDHVDVSFIAQHPQAVHAVQQTLGQLDTLLAHHGLSLGHAEVGQGGRGHESGQGGSSSGASAGVEDSTQEGSGLAAVAAPVIKAIGLLDMFA